MSPSAFSCSSVVLNKLLSDLEYKHNKRRHSQFNQLPISAVCRPAEFTWRCGLWSDCVCSASDVCIFMEVLFVVRLLPYITALRERIYFQAPRRSKFFTFSVYPFSKGILAIETQIGSQKSYLPCEKWRKLYQVFQDPLTDFKSLYNGNNHSNSCHIMDVLQNIGFSFSDISFINVRSEQLYFKSQCDKVCANWQRYIRTE